MTYLRQLDTDGEPISNDAIAETILCDFYNTLVAFSFAAFL